MKKHDAVLEILTENLPVKAAISAEKQLKVLAASLLTKAGLPFGGIETFATCRRLALYINEVHARAGGNDYGKSAINTLSTMFAGVIAGLKFHKEMLWGKGSIPFIRPLRGLLALYGNKTVVFSAAGLNSDRFSAGLSARGSPPLKISSAETYFKTLKEAGVLIKDTERLTSLRRALFGYAKRKNLKVDMDEKLLRENLYLVERPVCVAGRYPGYFLRLPPELIRLVLKKQLKLFPLCGRGNRLKPFFLAVTDGIFKRRDISIGFGRAVETHLRNTVFVHSRDLSADPRTGSITFSDK
ncbi:MAG: glycine--tRNA ligase subunit beta, partial [Elusimicrobiota bacterium]